MAGEGGLWVWACFTANRVNQDILSGQTQHPRELIEHNWVRMCGRHLKNNKQQELSIKGQWRVCLPKNCHYGCSDLVPVECVCTWLDTCFT